MDFWPVLLNRMPGWFFSAAAIVVLVGVGLVLWELGQGAKWFSQAIGRENLLLKLQEQLSVEREAARRNSAVASRLTTVLCNMREYTEALNRLSLPQMPNPSDAAGVLVQRVLEALSRDVKQEPGGLHRCGLWVGQDSQLVLSFGSSGFPAHYLKGGRRLSIDKSIAGKALRRNESLRKADATRDDDWEPSLTANRRYRALICIPVKSGDEPWGILTIDALNPMTDDDLLIGELYGTIIEGAFAYVAGGGLLAADLPGGGSAGQRH